MKEQFIYFKEILTGVQTDGPAKLIRALCFLVLFGGTVWAVMSYLNAAQLSDTSIEMNIPTRALTSNPQELDRVVSLAQNVSNMRTGGERLAGAMSAMNKKLFNTDSLMIPGMETAPVLGFEQVVSEDIPPEISVKAVMLTGKVGMAVVSVGTKRQHQGLIVRNGYELPEKAGKIIRIRSDGITVRQKDEDVDYTITQPENEEVNYMIK